MPAVGRLAPAAFTQVCEFCAVILIGQVDLELLNRAGFSRKVRFTLLSKYRNSCAAPATRTILVIKIADRRDGSNLSQTTVKGSGLFDRFDFCSTYRRGLVVHVAVLGEFARHLQSFIPAHRVFRSRSRDGVDDRRYSRPSHARIDNS